MAIENNFNKLILVSPRKSGTHLVTTWLGQRFAFKGQLEIGSTEDGLYSLGKTFHTSFKPFFKALDVEDFTGGMLLPISSCLGLLTCRHPADVLVSHLDYSFSNNNTSFAKLDDLDLETKINLYEDFFESLYEYTLWTKLPNFLVVDFETLAGSLKGDVHVQDSVVASLSEALHIPIKKSIFGVGATFNRGEVGRGLDFIKRNCPDVLSNVYYRLICDYYGYSLKKSGRPENINQINEKGVKLADDRPKGEVRLVEENFLEHRIVYYDGNLYALPLAVDFMSMFKQKKIEIVGKSLDEVRCLVGAASLLKQSSPNKNLPMNTKVGIKTWIKKNLLD